MNNKSNKKKGINYFDIGGVIGDAIGVPGLGAVTGAVTDLIGSGIKNLNVPNMKNTNISANNNDELMSAWNNNTRLDPNKTNLLDTALDGFKSGSLIGAAGNLFTGIIGNNNRGAQVNQLQQQQIANFDAKAGSINDKNIDNSLANYSAFGGNIFEGGGNFSNGVVTFNSGGTHEQNPDGGIPQGIGANGKPNLVEEGEVKYNDYIYSNRLKPDDNLLKEVGLPIKYAGKPFGEIADILSEESKERPNDPISKKGLDSNMDKLKQAQEILKLKKKQRERNAAEIVAIKRGQAVNADPQQGKLTDPNAPQPDPSQQGQQGQPDPNQPQQQGQPQGGQAPQQMAKGGKLSDGTNPQGIEPNMDQIMQEITGWLQQGMSPQQIVRQLVTAGIPAQQAAQLVQQVATQSKKQLPSGAGAQQQQGLQVPDASQQMAFGGNMFPNGGQPQSQGNQPQQGGQQQMEQVIQAVTQMIQKGMSPQQIIQELVKMGIPQQAATQLVQKVEQQAQSQGQGQGQQQPQGNPQQAQQQIAQQQGLQVPQQGQPMSFGGNLFAGGGNIFSGEQVGSNFMTMNDQYMYNMDVPGFNQSVPANAFAYPGMVKVPVGHKNYSSEDPSRAYPLNSEEGKNIIKSYYPSELPIQNMAGVSNQNNTILNSGVAPFNKQGYINPYPKNNAINTANSYSNFVSNNNYIPQPTNPVKTASTNLMVPTQTNNAFEMYPNAGHSFSDNTTPPPAGKGLSADLLRYAPAVGSGLMAASDALGLSNKADYTGADAMAGLKVQGQKVNNYLAYNPFDRDYYQNKLNANAGATREGLANASNGNRATYAAGLLGADANYNNGLGDLAVKGEQYNQEQKQKVEEFNRGTNQFNAQQSNWEQGINTDLMAKSIAMRMQAKDTSAQARSANLNNFLSNTGNVGREQASMNMINSNPALGYGINGNLDVYYKARQDAEKAAADKVKANKNSNGGKLSKKGITYGW